MKINNRRYIGSKSKLLPELTKILEKFPNEQFPKFFDAFGGTGVVTNLANSLGYKTTINDLLYCNYVAYCAWFSNEHVDLKKIKKYLKEFNEEKVFERNSYFSSIYGNKYYTDEVADKIYHIRERIEQERSKLNDREYYYLLTSLIYAADKCANTVGHFEHYLTHGHNKKKFFLEELELNNEESEILCADINTYIDSIPVKTDILYLDPPYNARQYINFYHVLENLARWEKPTEFEGKSMKFKREQLKSEYSRKNAILYFKHLVNTVDYKVLILSYNNTYNAKSGASNNKMQEKDIVDILSQIGKVRVIDVNYKAFQSGKTEFNNHIEKFFICEKIIK